MLTRKHVLPNKPEVTEVLVSERQARCGGGVCVGHYITHYAKTYTLGLLSV